MTPPVLFLVFNRPEPTSRVFAAIRAARPARLYVAADGPRDDRIEEAKACAEVRRIATHIDWQCELHTLFRNENWGCGRAVSDAITWFFNHEPEGIILEDDCLPHPSFFQFCSELLDRYRNDDKVMSISGSCFARPLVFRESYGFVYYADMWGWASWRRAWSSYDFKMMDWHASQHRLNDVFEDVNIKKYWAHHFDMVATKKVDTWDYQWIWAVMRANGLCIAPYRNMVVNIGFDSEATHTVDRDWAIKYRSLEKSTFPLNHPAAKIRECTLEAQIEQVRLGAYRKNAFTFLNKLRFCITDIQCYRGMVKIVPSIKKLKAIFS